MDRRLTSTRELSTLLTRNEKLEVQFFNLIMNFLNIFSETSSRIKSTMHDSFLDRSSSKAKEDEYFNMKG